MARPDDVDQHDGQRTPQAADMKCEAGMNAKHSKTAYELTDMIVERARSLHGQWPAGMTMFVFDDAYGWSASISRAISEADNVYRCHALDLITALSSRYDLASPGLSSANDYF
jgi:hypothetical protein